MNSKFILSEISLEELADKISERILSEAGKTKQTVAKRFITINELCEEYHMAKPTVYALTSKQEIPFIKRGKRLLFEREKIESWLQQGRKKTMDDIRDEFEPEN